MPDRERKGVPEHRSNVLKESVPQGPPAHPRNIYIYSLRSSAKQIYIYTHTHIYMRCYETECCDKTGQPKLCYLNELIK